MGSLHLDTTASLALRAALEAQGDTHDHVFSGGSGGSFGANAQEAPGGQGGHRGAIQPRGQLSGKVTINSDACPLPPLKPTLGASPCPS